jgi:hypothetical protein
VPQIYDKQVIKILYKDSISITVFPFAPDSNMTWHWVLLCKEDVGMTIWGRHVEEALTANYSSCERKESRKGGWPKQLEA